MAEAVIVAARRTPIGTLNGSLSGVSAPELAAVVIRSLLEQTGVDPAAIDEVIMGHVLQAGLGQNPARQAAVKAGVPQEVPSYTVNKVCGSGLKAVHLAAQAIRAGDAEVVLAGGMENMSQAPYLLKGARSGFKMGDQKLIDSMMHDGLQCALYDCAMGVTAENLSEQYGISREEQDEFAAWSQEKALRAMEEGKFKDEIVPVTVKDRKGNETIVEKDEHPRPGTTVETLSKLKPVFKEKGTVTAGNASGINDAAACLLVMSREKAEELALEPLAVIESNAQTGVDPRMMGYGPVPATRKALQKAGLQVEDVGLAEVNEAFAAQSLVVQKELNLAKERLNVNGGAIALGHPIGASGARVLVTLLHEMRKREIRYGWQPCASGEDRALPRWFQDRADSLLGKAEPWHGRVHL